MDEMKNIKALEKIYANLTKLIDNYADLPETKEAEKRFWEYAEKNIFQSKKNVKERELESVLYDVAHFNEKQGFIYGFNYALELTGKSDLLNIVMIGIADELPEHNGKYELHRLLSAVLSMELSVDEKLGIMEAEYGIPLDDKMREDVVIMCNLSQGIREKGRAEGKARSEIRVILNMHHNNFTLEQIALATGKSIEEVDAVIKGREPVLA